MNPQNKSARPGQDAPKQADENKIPTTDSPVKPAEPADSSNLQKTQMSPEQRDAELTRLASLANLDYEAERCDAAKRMGIGRVSVLDAEVNARRKAKTERKSGTAIAFPAIEPWEGEVNGAELLDAIVATFNRYIVLPPHAAAALALFVVATYAVECFDAAPYLNLTSPEKRCGKTLTLRLLTLLCYRACAAANCSEASVFRLIEECHPCLLFDEVDTFFKDKPQLRGILNAGNIRTDAFVLRTIEVRRGGVTDFQQRSFSLFGPKVFSGIGAIESTLADRSIVLRMARKRPDEKRQRFRRRTFHPEPIRAKCLRWIQENDEELRSREPMVPEALNDRAADLWEPLLIVAELAGNAWAECARAAAVDLSGDGDGSDNSSNGGLLLGDIRDIFEQQETRRLSSSALCSILATLEQRPWAEWNHGRPINPNKLSRLLKPYKVASRKLRLPDGSTPWGYDSDDFADAWERYLPKRNNGTTPVNTAQNGVLENGTEHPCSKSENRQNHCENKACASVPDFDPGATEADLI
jgi:hypothetical protein